MPFFLIVSVTQQMVISVTGQQNKKKSPNNKVLCHSNSEINTQMFVDGNKSNLTNLFELKYV